MIRQIFQSLGQFSVVFITGMLIYPDWKAVTAVGVMNAMWQPGLQGILAAAAIAGISRIPVGGRSNG